MAKTGAVLGGTLGGAGTGAAVGSVVPGVGTAIGAGAGALIGGLSGWLGSNDEEQRQRQQMLMRAADQRAAPWLAKIGEKTEFTPFDMGKSHSGDILEGALNGFSAYQNGQKAGSENDYRDALKQMMLNPDAAKQKSVLTALANSGSLPQGGVNDAALSQYILQMQNQA